MSREGKSTRIGYETIGIGLQSLAAAVAETVRAYVMRTPANLFYPAHRGDGASVVEIGVISV